MFHSHSLMYVISRNLFRTKEKVKISEWLCP